MTKADTEQWILTPQQERAVDLLASGKTVTDAAEALGVARQTVSEWLNHSTDFQETLAKIRQQHTQEALAFLRSCVSDAVQKLRDLLNSTNEGVAYRAATSLLNHALQAVEIHGLEERIRFLEQQLQNR